MPVPPDSSIDKAGLRDGDAVAAATEQPQSNERHGKPGCPLPVQARCIDHVNLSVSDLDASIEFYRRVLGTELKEHGGDEAGEVRWAILGARDRFYVCFFECPGGRFKVDDVHVNHVGFVVDDIDETVRRIHDLGYRLEFKDTLVNWPRSRSAYLKDPDGILIEFTDRFGGGLD